MIQVNAGDNSYVNPEQFLDAVDYEFVNRLKNRITFYGQIPYSVPTLLIIEMIKESALTFYRHSYGRAKQTTYLHLPASEIISFMRNSVGCCSEPNCKTYPNCSHSSHHIHPDSLGFDYRLMRGYGIKLPPYVSSIRSIYKVNEAEVTSSIESGYNGDYDMSDGFMSSSVSQLNFGFNGLRGINNHFYSYEKTTRLSEAAVRKTINSVGIPFSFNSGNHMLLLHADINRYDSLMIHATINVDVQCLYNDDLFIKYVYARCKKELKRLLGGHTFQLPGDVTMNADEICAGFEEEIQSVEEILKSHNSIGDIILMR